MLKLRLLLLSLALLMLACGTEKTDEELLAEDRAKLAKSLDSFELTYYRSVIIGIRTAASSDTTGMAKAILKARQLAHHLHRNNATDTASAEGPNVVKLYLDYRDVAEFVKNTDEDEFPTLQEGLAALYQRPESRDPLLQGDEKARAQNMEHATLSVLTTAYPPLGKSIPLYECSKTNPALIPNSDLKMLLHLFRGSVFMVHKLNYLAEYEITEGIAWQEAHPDGPYPESQSYLSAAGIEPAHAATSVHGLLYLLRGSDRLMMKRAIDHERAMSDLRVFVDDAHKIGLNNELVHAVEAYLAMEEGNKEAAIEALSKLRTSDLLTEDERSEIDASIEYIQSREEGAPLNSVQDKVFLGKVVSRWVYRKAQNVDWEQQLKQNDVPLADELMETMERVERVGQGLQAAESATEAAKETLKDAADAAKKEGEALLDQAKGFLNDEE